MRTIKILQMDEDGQERLVATEYLGHLFCKFEYVSVFVF